MRGYAEWMTGEYVNGAYFAEVAVFGLLYLQSVLFNYSYCVFGELLYSGEIDNFTSPD